MASPRNRTLQLSHREARARVATLPDLPVAAIESNVYQGTVEHALDVLPRNYFDLIIADPPYNHGVDFGNDSDRRSKTDYAAWTETWLRQLYGVVADSASVYICAN